MKLSCRRQGTTFILSAIKENGEIEQVIYDCATGHTIECLIGPKLEGEHYGKLRDMLPFVKKTTSQDSAGCDLKLVKWEGPIVVDEGIMVANDPLAVRTKKMIYRYENVESLLLDGWR